MDYKILVRNAVDVVICRTMSSSDTTSAQSSLASLTVDSTDFAALLIALHEIDDASNTAIAPSSSASTYIEADKVGMQPTRTPPTEEDDVLLAQQFRKEWKALIALCSINTPLPSPSDPPSASDKTNIKEVVQVIEHIKLNTTGKKCRCWIEPIEWHNLAKHKFVQKVVKPILCSVCFEPKTSGYAKLIYPIVPQQWILNNVAKSSYFYSLIYAAYVYNAYDKLFMAMGSSAMMAAYGKLVTKRRRKNQQHIINKRDSPIKQGEILCEHYIAPLVRTIDLKTANNSSSSVRDINTPLSPPNDFESVLMSSAAIQNEVYSLPSGNVVKKVIANPAPCYITQICNDIASTVDRQLHEKLQCTTHLNTATTTLCSCLKARFEKPATFAPMNETAELDQDSASAASASSVSSASDSSDNKGRARKRKMCD